MKAQTRFAAVALPILLGLTVLTAAQSPQGQTPPAGGQNPPPPPTMGGRLDVAEGSKVTYRVTEQFVGINFPSDASGSTNSVAGTLVVAKDGSIDASQSKLTVDLRTLKSDQDNRDNYLRTRTFETEKFPSVEFVPRRAEGLPHQLPGAGQAGFKLIGDMTVKGVTKEVAWIVVATFNPNQIAGRAKTEFTFATFELPKPTIARLLSVDDKIALEIEFRAKRSALP